MNEHCRSWSETTETVSAGGVCRRAIDGQAPRLVQAVIPAGTKAPRHSHGGEPFVQGLSGSGTLETDQGRAAFGPGSVFHVPPHVAHAAEFDTETVPVEIDLPV